MSFELYVGNLPSHFSKENVGEIFKEFKGVKVLKTLWKGPKCYSFVSCVDLEQLLSVIEEKNNAIVGGRKIIVRASNKELNDYVNLLLEENNKTTLTEQCEEKQEFSTPQFDRKSTSGSYSESHLSSSTVSDRGSGSLSCSLSNKKSNEVHEKEQVVNTIPHLSVDTSSFSQLYRNVLMPVSSHASFSSAANKRDFSECDDRGRDQTTFEYLDEHGNLHSLEYNDEYENYAWVSVTNFPLWTESKDILNLFSDYNPACICMICNKPRRDKTLTEAFVGFSLQQDADDVILNFDNTLWHNRCLLVTDCEDLTVMKELLNFST